MPVVRTGLRQASSAVKRGEVADDLDGGGGHVCRGDKGTRRQGPLCAGVDIDRRAAEVVVARKRRVGVATCDCRTDRSKGVSAGASVSGQRGVEGGLEGVDRVDTSRDWAAPSIGVPASVL